MDGQIEEYSMGEKILTVSIAAYNVSKFIRKALDSLILDEDHMKSLEVIIVNDGSTDDTSTIAREYAYRYPQTFLIIDKENGGYGSTINASLSIAEGRYFKLLDGDDWYDQEGLCGLIDYLEKTDSDLIVSPYNIVKPDVKTVPHHSEIPMKQINISELRLNDKLFQMHGITVKTDTLRKYKHPIAEHCFYTDIEFVFYCLAASETIARYNCTVYNYRLDINGQSVSLAGIQKHYEDHPKVTDRICKCYERECLKFEGGKKGILSYAVTFSIYGAFNNYMVLKDAGKHKRELSLFDKQLAEKYPNAYKAGNDSSVVRTTRRLRFHLYWLMCRYMKFKFGRF